MSRFCQFTQKEFENFLLVGDNGKPTEKGGFHRITLPYTHEMVYGKRISPVLSLRIYSTIEHGVARDCGSDAIRICIVWRPSEQDQRHWESLGLAHRNLNDLSKPIWPMLVGGEIKVLRVQGWRENLGNRLANQDEIIPPNCQCGAPSRLITPKKKNGKKPSWNAFWGCVWYPNCPSSRRFANE